MGSRHGAVRAIVPVCTQPDTNGARTFTRQRLLMPLENHQHPLMVAQFPVDGFQLDFAFGHKGHRHGKIFALLTRSARNTTFFKGGHMPLQDRKDQVLEVIHPFSNSLQGKGTGKFQQVFQITPSPPDVFSGPNISLAEQRSNKTFRYLSDTNPTRTVSCVDAFLGSRADSDPNMPSLLPSIYP